MTREREPSQVARELSRASRRWYRGLPPATAEIDCGGAQHRITWRRGRLVLEDHDLLAERSLAALGAEPPICIEVLEAWRAMRSSELLCELLLRDRALSPVELALAKSAHAAAMDRAQRQVERMRSRLKGDSEQLSRFERQARERASRPWETALIDALPPRLRRPLALSVVVNIARHWADDAFRSRHARPVESALSALAAPLFELSARRWRRNFKPYATFVAETWLLRPAEHPTCAAWADSGGAYAALSLPISWFTDVWARGVALVDGCLVLDVVGRPGGEGTLRVLALRWEREHLETSKAAVASALVTRLSGGGWRLTWL